MLWDALARHHRGMRAPSHTVHAGGVGRVILFLGKKILALRLFGRGMDEKALLIDRSPLSSARLAGTMSIAQNPGRIDQEWYHEPTGRDRGRQAAGDSHTYQAHRRTDWTDKLVEAEKKGCFRARDNGFGVKIF